MATHYSGTEEETIALDSFVKLSRAADTVTHRTHQHLNSANLSVSQFGVLEALAHIGPLQPSQLAQKVLKSGGNMTLVIDNLVKRGLVQRQRRTDDRRCIDITLTDEGSVLINQIFPNHVRGVVQAMSALTLDEQRQLAGLCRKLGLANQE